MQNVWFIKLSRMNKLSAKPLLFESILLFRTHIVTAQLKQRNNKMGLIPNMFNLNNSIIWWKRHFLKRTLLFEKKNWCWKDNASSSSVIRSVDISGCSILNIVELGKRRRFSVRWQNGSGRYYSSRQELPNAWCNWQRWIRKSVSGHLWREIVRHQMRIIRKSKWHWKWIFGKYFHIFSSFFTEFELFKIMLTTDSNLIHFFFCISYILYLFCIQAILFCLSFAYS